jgi:hypothetical protein
MSTIAVTNVKHPSAVDPAIVLDADGDVTYAGVHDFSAATVTGAPQGLVHVATESFSAVSSVSLNNVFTSAYDNYLVLIYFTASGQTGGTLRMRASGTDDTGTNYQWQENEVQSTAYTGTRSTGATSMNTGGTGSDPGSHTTLEIFSPFLAQRTGFKSQTYLTISGAWMRVAFGQMTNTTSFDGFTLAPGSGTISGTVRVYGYQNS